MFYSIAAVACGAALGALLRWLTSLKLNPICSALPLGTLASNLIGGYLIGVAIAFFSHRSELPHELRLFIVTGFLGALTTFSTFSAEVVSMLQQNRLGSAMAVVILHVCGSLTMTWLGMQTVQAAIR